MKFYYAPMEGITQYPLRNIHKEVFGNSVDRYFTAFVTAPKTFHFKNREKKDILPDKNTAFEDYPERIVPQIMSGNAETFLWAAKEMKKLGYNEANLNLGCPAPTVVNRHKGAGLLQDTDYLDEMLGEIFEEVGKCANYPAISIKTRLGFYSEDEAEDIMRIFAKYPIKELIVHARIREDFYAGAPRLDAFKNAVNAYIETGGRAEICYNGNINSPDDYADIMKQLGQTGDFSSDSNLSDTALPGNESAVSSIINSTDKSGNSSTDKYGDSGTGKSGTSAISSVMIGRGLLANPALVRELRGGPSLKPDELRHYLTRLYDSYAEFIPDDRNVIFKMLEHWAFLHVHFKNCDKYLKAIRKSRTKGEYLAAVNNIFASCEFV